MKNAIILLCLVCVAATAHSQAVLLEKNENSFFVEAGIAGQNEVDSYGLAVGLTFLERFDVGAAIARDIRNSNVILGQFLSFNFIREDVGSSIFNLSFDQSFATSPAEGQSVLSLGGSFSHRFKFATGNAVLVSAGYSRIVPVKDGGDEIDTFPFGITLAIRGKQNYYYLSPFVSYATNDNTVYGVSIGYSLVRNGEE